MSQCFRIPINWNRRILIRIVDAQFINAMNVIRVHVCVENGINAFDLMRERLLTQIRRRVDEKHLAVDFKETGRSQSIIFLIG
jgi:hypothetical protein